MTGTTDTGEGKSGTLVVIRSLLTIADLKRNEALARATSTAPPLTLKVQNQNQVVTLLALAVGTARSPSRTPLTPTLGLGPIRPN